MLDLHRLRLLREVQALGTVRAAARSLGYSPAAVSQQLATLEREMRTPLFERSGRNLHLTPAGEVLVEHAGALLVAAEAAEADVAAVAAGQLSGTVRVAAFQSAFLHVVAPAIRALAETHPRIRVVATEAEAEAAGPALRRQQVDIALGDEYEAQPREVHPDLARVSLLHEGILAALPADHPDAGDEHTDLARLADLPWAACQPGTGHHRMSLRVCRQIGGFEPDVHYLSDDLLILLELVSTVGAVALLPELVLLHEHAGVVRRPLSRGPVHREVYLLARRSSTPTVQAVVDALVTSARAVDARLAEGRRGAQPLDD